MANTVAAQGFQPFGYASGWTPAFGFNSDRKILATYATKIHRGTPVIGLSTGYLNVATASTVQMAGIFWGCEYYSSAMKRTIKAPYWPAGSPSVGDAIAYIIDDPNVLFKVQSDGTAAWALADIGNNVQLVTGTGNDVTGLSGYLGNHTTATTNTFPFRLMSLLSAFVPAGTDGADDTSPSNFGIVRLNLTDRVSALGI